MNSFSVYLHHYYSNNVFLLNFAWHAVDDFRLTWLKCDTFYFFHKKRKEKKTVALFVIVSFHHHLNHNKIA